MNEDERLQEIQERLKKKLESDLHQKTTWNQTMAYAWCPDHNSITEEFQENALNDMVWLMQQYETKTSYYIARLKALQKVDQDELGQEDE